MVEEGALAPVSKPPIHRASSGELPGSKPASETASMPYVYIVECADGSLYVGSTFNLELRLHQHNSDRDGAKYTRRRRPVKLVWSAWFDSIAEAFAFEKQVQGWRREKRVALIEGRFDDLPALARRRGGSG